MPTTHLKSATTRYRVTTRRLRNADLNWINAPSRSLGLIYSFLGEIGLLPGIEHVIIKSCNITEGLCINDVTPIRVSINWDGTTSAPFRAWRHLGVVHIWRHAIFDNFWHPLHQLSRFLLTKALSSQNLWYPLPPKTVTSFMDNPLVKNLSN